MSAPRAAGWLAVVLAMVIGLGYVASQTIAARPSVDLVAPQYVAAPVPGQDEPPVQPGEPVGSPVVAAGWVDKMARRTGIPAPALRAYARVQLAGTAGCPIGWTTLAGVGWIESQHGTIDGRRLRADGRSSSAILGPQLDGTGAFAAIPSTAESLRWHTNTRWEHAVGPMQFLPTTWQQWETDGDGDGVADPHDLDDAAAAAGRYLCASGADVTTSDGWSAAVLTYNRSNAYVRDVYEAASVYATRAG